jgi:hypothetical protein
MPKYVVGKKAVIVGSGIFTEGQVVTLTEDQAEALGLNEAKKKDEKEADKKK